jgi:transposase
MSGRLLYHGFGIRGYCYVRTDVREGRIELVIRQPRERFKCPVCGTKDVIAKGQTPRSFRTVGIGSKQVRIVLPVPRVLCRACGIIRQVTVDFADERVSYTRSFERYALELSRSMTIQDVARHLSISWDVIKDIQKRHLQTHYAKPKLGHLTQLAIDEIHIGKGQKYVTVVLDLESGAVVFLGKGKGSEALEPFWKRLKRSRAQIEAVAIDMSPAYTFAVTTNLPDAVLVYDRFHVMKLFNEKLSDLRRDLYREATTQLQKDVLKGTRWLLLKNPENLDRKHREPQRLRDALRLNESLATAYYLKEWLGWFWEQPDRKAAELHLDLWIFQAEASGVRMLQQFAKTLQQHRAGLLNWYRYPISTGPLEGTNNKIQTMKRQAYGYRDLEFFQLKIYAIHTTKYALVG